MVPCLACFGHIQGSLRPGYTISFFCLELIQQYGTTSFYAFHQLWDTQESQSISWRANLYHQSRQYMHYTWGFQTSKITIQSRNSSFAPNPQSHST